MSLRYIYSYFPFRSLRSFSRRLKKAKGKSYYASNLKTVIFLFEKEHDMKLENVLVYKEHRRLKHFTFLLVAASDISISLNLETKHGYRLPSSSFYLHPNSESWIYIKRYGGWKFCLPRGKSFSDAPTRRPNRRRGRVQRDFDSLHNGVRACLIIIESDFARVVKAITQGKDKYEINFIIAEVMEHAQLLEQWKIVRVNRECDQVANELA